MPRQRPTGLITFVGVLSAVACYLAPVHPYANWIGWCLWGFLCGFVLPVGVILALGEPLTAWGITLGDWKRGLAVVVVGVTAMGAVGWWAAQRPDFRAYYLPLTAHLRANLIAFWLALAAYMLGWEFLFRGFLLFGLAGTEKPVPTRRLVGAIAFSTLLFGLSHLGKPLPEVAGSFCAGVILCVVAWTTRSIMAPVLLHTFVFGMFTAQVAWLNR